MYYCIKGVTIGGTGKEQGKRHPTLNNNVVVGSGAKILGNITIGNNVRVGAGSVVIGDVPDNSTVVGIPGRIIMQNGEKISPLRHDLMPDPVVDALKMLSTEVKELKELVQQEIKTCNDLCHGQKCPSFMTKYFKQIQKTPDSPGFDSRVITQVGAPPNKIFVSCSYR